MSKSKTPKRRLPRDEATLADIRDGRKLRAYTRRSRKAEASRTACRGKVTA